MYIYLGRVVDVASVRVLDKESGEIQHSHNLPLELNTQREREREREREVENN